MNRIPMQVPALVYHKIAEVPDHSRYDCNYVRPKQFAAQLRWLRRAGYQSVSIGQYVAYRKGRGALPAKPIIITFDDGYRSLLDSAFPLLAEYGFSATVFLVSSLLGKTNSWDDDTPERLLDLRDVRAMHERGIEFQSHTRTHVRLTDISPERASFELKWSRVDLEQLLGASVSVIAYPWAAQNADVRRLAEAAGYTAGVIMRRRTNFAHTPLFELRRIGINHQTSLARFGWDLARLRWRGA